MFTLITGGEIYDPSPRGRQDVLIAHDRIARIGTVDARAIEATGLGLQVIDGTGCLVTPGLIDSHEHLIGGSGEQGFATQTPEIAFHELVEGGITTVVGCLGVDTSTKGMPALVAKAKGLRSEGLSSWVYTGGYDVPPVTLTGSVRSDLLFVDEAIGAGEIAISDRRSTQPAAAELARVVRQAYVGGILSGKAGITHFHVGEERSGLAPLRALLEDFEIEPALLYPTHVERSEALMAEAIALTRAGVTVDVDTVERDLARWVKFYFEHDGDPCRLTASSDAAINSPGTLLEQIQLCVVEHRLPLERILPLVTTNTAAVLRLADKGRLQEGAHADLLTLRKGSLELVDVMARGRLLLRAGRLQRHEAFLSESNRSMTLHGEKIQRLTPA
jgi:beta-aspartyl-dipeptidase (metallo-type)